MLRKNARKALAGVLSMAMAFGLFASTPSFAATNWSSGTAPTAETEGTAADLTGVDSDKLTLTLGSDGHTLTVVDATENTGATYTADLAESKLVLNSGNATVSFKADSGSSYSTGAYLVTLPATEIHNAVVQEGGDTIKIGDTVELVDLDAQGITLGETAHNVVFFDNVSATKQFVWQALNYVAPAIAWTDPWTINGAGTQVTLYDSAYESVGTLGLSDLKTASEESVTALANTMTEYHFTHNGQKYSLSLMKPMNIDEFAELEYNESSNKKEFVVYRDGLAYFKADFDEEHTRISNGANTLTLLGKVGSDPKIATFSYFDVAEINDPTIGLGSSAFAVLKTDGTGVKIYRNKTDENPVVVNFSEADDSGYTFCKENPSGTGYIFDREFVFQKNLKGGDGNEKFFHISFSEITAFSSTTTVTPNFAGDSVTLKRPSSEEEEVKLDTPLANQANNLVFFSHVTVTDGTPSVTYNYATVPFSTTVGDQAYISLDGSKITYKGKEYKVTATKTNETGVWTSSETPATLVANTATTYYLKNTGDTSATAVTLTYKPAVALPSTAKLYLSMNGKVVGVSLKGGNVNGKDLADDIELIELDRDQKVVAGATNKIYFKMTNGDIYYKENVSYQTAEDLPAGATATLSYDGKVVTVVYAENAAVTPTTAPSAAPTTTADPTATTAPAVVEKKKDVFRLVDDNATVNAGENTVYIRSTAYPNKIYKVKLNFTAPEVLGEGSLGILSLSGKKLTVTYPKDASGVAKTEDVDISTYPLNLVTGINTIAFKAADNKIYSVKATYVVPMDFPKEGIIKPSYDGKKLSVTVAGYPAPSPAPAEKAAPTVQPAFDPMASPTPTASASASASPNATATATTSASPSSSASTSPQATTAPTTTPTATPPADVTEEVTLEEPLKDGENTVFFKISTGAVFKATVMFDASAPEVKETEETDPLTGNVTKTTISTYKDGTVTKLVVITSSAGAELSSEFVKTTKDSAGSDVTLTIKSESGKESIEKIVASTTGSTKYSYSANNGAITYSLATMTNGVITTATVKKGASSDTLTVVKGSSKDVYTIKNGKATVKSTKAKKYSVPKAIEVPNLSIVGTGIERDIEGSTVSTKVTSLASKAFKNNNTITKLASTGNLTSIASSAFESCKKITESVIGNVVKTIGSKAFFKTKKMKKTTIGTGVTSIGSKAYNGSGLKTIIIKSKKIKKIASGAFGNINKKATFKLSGSKAQKAKVKKMILKAGAPKSVKFK